MSEDKLRDYYTLNLPNSLRILFEAYISRFPNLGYKNVSQYILHLLQKRAEEIIEGYPEFQAIEKITLASGTYTLQKDGTYKKIK